MSRYYDWHATLSRQTGIQGEICIVVGAKGIGKTFGLRLQCVMDYIRHRYRFCEICRTKTEMQQVKAGYFDKLKASGKLGGYIFKVVGNTGYISADPDALENIEYDDNGEPIVAKPSWEPICYFVALTNFQTDKKRTYVNIRRFIFDEAVIDRKDRYHRYLPDEFFILGNMLDTVSREQPGDDAHYNVYILGNACDLTCPYMRYLGINEIPDFGYHWYKDKTVLLHYVEPWDADERKARTLVGRMLKDSEESAMVFDNLFEDTGAGEVMKKTSAARYRFSIKYNGNIFSFWFDMGRGLCFVTSKTPKDAQIVTISKADSGIDYQAVERNSPYLKMLNRLFYDGLLRYDSIAMRDMFLTILDFLGIR